MKDLTSFPGWKVNDSMNLIFDLDDTLVHTDYANYISYSEAFQQVHHSEFKVSYNPDKRFTRESLIKEFSFLSKEDIEKIIRLKDELFLQNLNKTELNYPVAEILEKYKYVNNTILVTNSRKERAVETLKHHKLFEVFSRKYFKQKTPENSNSNKYEYALKAMEIHPLKVIIFENDSAEIEAALRAGIPDKNIYRV